MKNIHFFHQPSKDIWKLLSTAADHAGWDRHRVFRDWLTMALCALSAGKKEDLYMETIKPYTAGEKGKRPIDQLAEAFAVLLAHPEHDLLGDVFQGAITGGEAGQFFTPECLCRLSAQMCHADKIKPKQRIHDPACGSGRMLIAAWEIEPKAVYYGTDVDHRCAMMTAINMAIRGMVGFSVWGNSLTLEFNKAYWNSYGIIIDTGEMNPLICQPPKKEIRHEPVQQVLFT